VPPWHLAAVAVPPAALWGLLLIGLPGRVALGLLVGAVAAAVWVGTAPARVLAAAIRTRPAATAMTGTNPERTTA
jgi:hypothetical protein